MKVKNQKESKKDEFRKEKETGHPAYIYAKIGNKFKYIGITHAKITDGMENIKLDKNPNPKDQKESYIRPYSQQKSVNKFKKVLIGWFLSKSDKDKIDKLK